MRSLMLALLLFIPAAQTQPPPSETPDPCDVLPYLTQLVLGGFVFQCATPTTMPVPGEIDLASLQRIVIDGNNTLTIERTRAIIGFEEEDDTGLLFDIPEGASVTLRNLTVIGPISNNGDLILENVTAIDTTSQFGGFLFLSDGATATISDSVFRNNTAEDGDGGAIYNHGTLTIDNSTFENNLATGSSSSTDSPGGFGGGAIFNDGATITISNSRFIGNLATSRTDQDGGGAINNFAHGGETATLTVENSLFVRNKAVSSGGAIVSYVRDGGGEVVLNLSHNTFAYNAARFGGAIRHHTLEVDNSIATTTIRANIFLSGLDGMNCLRERSGWTTQGYNFSDDMPCGSAPTDVTTRPIALSRAFAPMPGSDLLALVPFDCPTTDIDGNERATPCTVGAFE